MARSESNKRGIKFYPRKHYHILFVSLCYSLKQGKSETLNKIVMEKFDSMTPLEKDRLHILYSKMTDAQKRNPKLLPGETE